MKVNALSTIGFDKGQYAKNRLTPVIRGGAHVHTGGRES